MVKILTYSASTKVRAELLASGFWVAEGPSSGPKATTTVAFTAYPSEPFDDEPLLGDAWLGRFSRSEFFQDLELRNAVVAHSQFKSL